MIQFDFASFFLSGSFSIGIFASRSSVYSKMEVSRFVEIKDEELLVNVKVRTCGSSSRKMEAFTGS